VASDSIIGGLRKAVGDPLTTGDLSVEGNKKFISPVGTLAKKPPQNIKNPNGINRQNKGKGVDYFSLFRGLYGGGR
tara:strand:+ start:1108 stop:1335 length:228 start_codon:yes stop_codon:yes gene_type:complete